MRVGIDVRPLEGESGRRGVGTYIRGLVSGLLEEGGEDELVLFHRDQTAIPGAWGLPRPRAALVLLTRPSRGVTIWDQISWPGTLAREEIDVFHSPFWTLPLLAGARRALVQTIHDLTPVKLAGSVSLRNELIFRANFACARSARRVIVPSQATRADAISLAGIRPDRIRAVPEGVDLPESLIREAETALPEIRRRLALEGRYLLHTGGQDAVKNLDTTVEAAARLVARGADLRLVVTGQVGGEGRRAAKRAAALGLGGRLVMPGHLPRVELVALYLGAAALLYPSSNEGFGLPLLEAMACGTPVVAARAGALPEVGGGACLYAEPGDAGGLAAAAASILDDDALARRLSSAGRRRAASFTWRAAARATLDVYREAAAAGNAAR